MTNINKETNILKKCSSISFTLGVSGFFEPFETVSSSEYYIPNAYFNGISSQNPKAQLLNDWGVVFLPNPIGETVKTLYGLNSFSYFQVKENGLFSFFAENETQSISKLTKLSPEISIIGYSESIIPLSESKETKEGKDKEIKDFSSLQMIS